MTPLLTTRTAMLDPVLCEIVKNALLIVAQEAGIRAARSAGSTFVSQGAEVACALFDDKARLITQTYVGQMHISALRGMLKAVLEDHPPETLVDGDVLVTNDPFRGGIHPTDVGAFRPIFIDGRPAYYCGVMMIVSDLGGVSAGGLPANASECFHEGLMIPPLKLYEAGRLNEPIARIVRANSRTPGKVAADIDALAAGGNVAAARMAELVAKYGHAQLSAIIEELLDYSERLVRASIEALPDGVYRGDYVIDEDGVEPGKTHRVQVEITIKGSDVRFDFTGTDRQARGAINASHTQSLSCVAFALRCYLEPGIPMNEGFYRPVEAIFPPGSLVNVQYPAACNLRLAAGMAIVDSILRAWAGLYPERAIASGATVHTMNAHGKLPPGPGSAGEKMWGMLDVTMGPGGARASKDACDGLPFLLTASSGYERNCEAYEWSTPVRYRRYALAQDSGGAGRYRGGNGVVKDIEFLTDALITVRATDRCITPPQGAAGGLSGALPGMPSPWVINHGAADEVVLPPKCTNHPVKAGDVLTSIVPGGGGWGDPLQRPPETVAEDVRTKAVSVGAAKALYGVVLDAAGTVDGAATARLRQTMRGR
jgi:N-methylhydantoinase B